MCSKWSRLMQKTRIGRRFLSRYEPDSHVEQTMDGMLDAFQRRHGAVKEFGVVDGYKVQAKLTRESEVGCSWLVAVAPVTSD